MSGKAQLDGNQSQLISTAMEKLFGIYWKKKFVLLFLFLCTAICGLIAWTLFSPLLARRIPLEEFGLERLKAETDQDEDGLDDQSDIYQSALDYLETSPSYKSEYYPDGYPDDGNGVCTDVIGFALLGAGYNLRDLMNEDIQHYPEKYQIDEPDPNIDFRRVRNIKVWLDRHAKSLSLDLSDPLSWQPGDIVVFLEHIGIVSEYRNEHNVPFIVHLRGGLQLSWTEDILETRNDLVGHYRITNPLVP